MRYVLLASAAILALGSTAVPAAADDTPDRLGPAHAPLAALLNGDLDTHYAQYNSSGLQPPRTGYQPGPGPRPYFRDNQPGRPFYGYRGSDGGRAYGGRAYYGRPYYGRGYYGGRYYRHDYGSAAAAGAIGLATGAIIGGALAQQAAPVYAAPNGAVSYCVQRFKSYDPASGTYLGYDGLRHPCP